LQRQDKVMNRPGENRQLNILLVDGTGQIMDFLEKLKNIDRYFVDQVETTEDAVSRLKEETYDIIIADGSIPKKRGVKLLKKAQQAQPDATAVLVTPGLDKEAQKEAREIDALYCSEYLMIESVFMGM